MISAGRYSWFSGASTMFSSTDVCDLVSSLHRESWTYSPFKFLIGCLVGFPGFSAVYASWRFHIITVVIDAHSTRALAYLFQDVEAARFIFPDVACSPRFFLHPIFAVRRSSPPGAIQNFNFSGTWTPSGNLNSAVVGKLHIHQDDDRGFSVA